MQHLMFITVEAMCCANQKLPIVYSQVKSFVLSTVFQANELNALFFGGLILWWSSRVLGAFLNYLIIDITWITLLIATSIQMKQFA